jgi:hypothetical protein
MLHAVEGNNVRMGILKDKDSVIDLIKSKDTIYTATWDYTNESWANEKLFLMRYETEENI